MGAYQESLISFQRAVDLDKKWPVTGDAGLEMRYFGESPSQFPSTPALVARLSVRSNDSINSSRQSG